MKKVIVIAPAHEAALLKGALPEDFVVTQETPTLTQETAAEIGALDAQLVIVSSNTPGFAIKHIRTIRQASPDPRVIMVFAQPFGDQFDLLQQEGAIAYKIPVRAEAVEEVTQHFDELLAQATQRFVQGDTAVLEEQDLPDHTASMAMGYGALLRTTPYAFWGLSGGVGKSTITRDIASLLAGVAGRRVLIVDADMSRGMMATLYSPEVFHASRTKHVAALANLYHATGKVPLREQVIPLPLPEKALAAQQKGVLHLLAGLPNPDMATMEGFTGDNGKAGERFVEALLKAAREYEFVLFDLGPIIPVPLHLGALKQAALLFVISRPQRGDVVQLGGGLKSLMGIGIPAERMRLVVNMYTGKGSVTPEDIASSLKIPTIARIPASPAVWMQELANSGQSALEFWLEHRKDEAATNYLRALIPMVEVMLPGTAQIIKGRFPELVVSRKDKEKSEKKKRRWLF